MEHIRLGDIYRITKGKKIEPLEELVDEAIRYIQIDDLRNDNNLKYCLNDKKYVIADKDDLIIAWDGANAGTIGYGLSGAIGSTLARLSTSNDNIYTPFVGRYMQSQSKELRDKCTGATIPHIQKSVLEDVLIPKYDISTQKMLANILDKAQYLIDSRKEQIQACDELIKSQFVGMFGDPVTNPNGWGLKKCKDIASKIGSGATPKGGNASYKETGISLIRSMNVHNNSFVYKDLAYIDDEQADKLSNVVVEESDVLLNITGASVARSCIVPKEVLPARVNQHVSIVRCKQDVIQPIFLCHLFTNESYQKLLWSIATSGGATREAITKQQEEELNVIVPPVELQNQFAQFVQQVDKLKFEMQHSLVELENNFNALMQRAFKGELF